MSAASAVSVASASVIVLLLLLFGVGAIADEESPPATPVKVSVYYESLCPDSYSFIVRQLYPTWQNLSDIFTPEIYAYGKAQETEKSDQFECQCQHGPGECKGNIMLACAKEHLTDFDQFMAFTYCVMNEFKGSTSGLYCAKEVGFNFTDIEMCQRSEEGERLLHEVGVTQSTLDPPLTYVPWILINDNYTKKQRREAQKDLRKVVCDAYQGTKPLGCL